MFNRLGVSLTSLIVSLGILTPAWAQSAQCRSSTQPQPLSFALRKSVIITDLHILQSLGDFSIGRTLGNIISTAGKTALSETSNSSMALPPVADTPAERIALLATLVRSFRVQSLKHPSNQLDVPVGFRPGEASLDPIELIDPNKPRGLRAVGLFNRMDLMPADFSDCGEHRIVYAMGEAKPTVTLPGGNQIDGDRFLIIFEAKVPNPDPSQGLAGCRPVAAFWDELKDKSGSELARALEKFYYEGLTDSIGPVVHHRNYGLPLGQVRGNLFVTNGDPNTNRWQLREWRITVSADKAPVFTADPVKVNPMPVLYGAKAPSEDISGIPGLRTDFSEKFLKDYLAQLAATEKGEGRRPEKKTEPNELINELGASIDERFNAFVSFSQGNTDIPLDRANNTPLKTAIDQKIADPTTGIPASCNLTAAHELNRAGAISCGGCHSFSKNQEIAPGVRWPADRNFVHIDENGDVSVALENHFLPFRREMLERALQPPPPPPSPPAVEASQASTQVARTLQRIRGAETRLQSIDAVRDLENEVIAVRDQDQQKTGAFRTYRRVH